MTAASGLAVDNAAKPPVFWVPLLKDAGLAALVAVLLALPLVGLQTYDIGGGALGIRTHFDWVAIAGAAVFAGRLALRVLQQLYRARPRAGQGSLTSLAAWGNRQVLPITLVGIGFAVALPFLPFSSRYLIDLGTTVLIYVMLGWGLNVVVGLAGLLDLGYVAFYAVGAYTFGSAGARSRVSLSGKRCRFPVWWRRASASFSAFRYCGCAATISRSSRSALARSSASCC